MIMTVDGQIRLKDVPRQLWHNLTAQLTVPNPEYTTALRLGTPTYGVPHQIMLYEVRDNELVVPRGLWLEIWRRRPQGTVQRKHTVQLAKVHYSRSKIQLRDYQDGVAETFLKGGHPQGVIVMPCGSGKTETGLYILSQLQQSALWITHTHDLVTQAVERAKERLGLLDGEVGVYGGTRREIGSHLTVATVQTLYNTDLDELAGCFGAVVVDECHRVVNNPEKASMFCRVLACLPAHYRIGLTASPNRGDGLEDTIYQVLGPELGRVAQDVLQQNGSVVTPLVKPLVTGFTYRPAPGEDKVNFGRLLRHIADNSERQQQVVSYVASDALEGHSCLVLASHLDLLEKTSADLQAQGIDTRFIHGKLQAADRRAALGDMRSGQCRVLCATYQLAKEGLDIPVLDRVFLASPVRNSTAVQQTLGRVMRPAPGKTDAVVYDFVDKAVGVCKSQHYARKRVYKNLNCEIEKEIAL